MKIGVWIVLWNNTADSLHQLILSIVFFPFFLVSLLLAGNAR